MRIIKNGNIKKLTVVKTFHCDFCGCLFEADNTAEYKTHLSRNGIYYYTRCPFCGKIVYRKEN